MGAIASSRAALSSGKTESRTVGISPVGYTGPGEMLAVHVHSLHGRIHKTMKKLMLAALLLVSASGLFGQFSIGIRIGPPPQPRTVRVNPRSPGAGYAWVDGYWYPNAGRYKWHGGYWTSPPYNGANWARPRYEGGQYYQGYWQGDSRQSGHDHRWDRNRRSRDYDHDDRNDSRNNNRGRGRGNR